MVAVDKAKAARALAHVVCALPMTAEATRRGRAVTSAYGVRARVAQLKQMFLLVYVK